MNVHPILNSSFYKKLTKHQKSIIDEMVNGAVLKSTEGANYRAWLRMPNGMCQNVTKRSAESICAASEAARWLVFGSKNGDITLKGRVEKWKEECILSYKKMTNKELLDECIAMASGDDYDGCFTTEGMWEFTEVQKELTERLTSISFL